MRRLDKRQNKTFQVKARIGSPRFALKTKGNIRLLPKKPSRYPSM